MGTIVVGVDGSPAALAALRFALAEARLRGARLVALYAWVLPLAEAPGPFLLGWPDEVGPTVDQLGPALGRAAEERLAAALREVADEAEGVEVERRAVEGPAATMLLEAAAGADLLVVGSRGHGGFRGLLLGSVSQQCAQHARCPVVIVPAPESADDRDA
jgi:nucleotide-binding universal stress UspA family protein